MTGQGEPTAAIRRVDVSASDNRASASPAVPEKAETILFRAYGSLLNGQRGLLRVTDMRVEPCACGGTLALEEGASVQEGVDAHNQTPQHQAWRARRETA